MKQHVSLWLTGLLCVACHGAVSAAQEISVTDERPVAKAIEKLEAIYRVPISYEDTRYLSNNDMTDVTEAVRLDQGKGDDPSRVFVPARRTLTFDLPETPARAAVTSPSERSAAALAALKGLLDSDALAGGTGGFQVSEDSSGLHVVSRSYRDASGRTQKLKPVLDGQITLKVRSQPALDVLDEICKQLSPDGGAAINVGTVPMNLLANSPVDVEAKNVAARDALESISKQIGARVAWQLLCEPGDGECALNMHIVR